MTASLWGDKPPAQQDAEAFSRLSRIVSGNDNLVTQPGLVQALIQGNASVQQSSALDQFIGGLEAEKLVRNASGTGQKIKLSDQQQSALDEMGIDYRPVLYTQKDAISDLTEQMAAKGLKPVLDNVGNVQTDAHGNPLAQKIEKPHHDSGGGGLFGFISKPFKAIGHGAMDIFHGHLPGVTPVSNEQSNPVSIDHLAKDATMGYNWASSYLVDSANPLKEAHADSQDEILARAMGYDPNSWFSMQAFRAKGYYHRDDSKEIDKWDAAHPDGKFGMDGQRAVTEAAVFAADPKKYVSDITSDQTLSPEEAASKLAAVSSDDFKNLVLRVSGNRADIGAATARAVGIDPVHSATTFNVVAAGTNLAAQFATDPLAFGLGAYRNAQISSVAIKNLSDAGSITRILKPAEGVATSVAQRRVIAHLNDMVDHSNALRQATEAGDSARAAQLDAAIQSNPFAGLKSDFLGEDQILGVKSEQSLAGSTRGQLPFITGRGGPITTFDEATDYLASKSALLRLQGGFAPIETSYMPGAMSAYGYTRLKGRIAAWSTGRSALQSDAAAERFVSAAAADPARLAKAKSAGYITDADVSRFLPQEYDAVDMGTGNVLAGGQKAEGELASARRAAELSITDAGRGYLRGNKLRYGTFAEPNTAIGKAVSIYTMGTLQRAKLVATRFSNWLPRDTNVDLTSASSADTVLKVAKTYLSKGDAHMLSARWAAGNGESRRAIVRGLQDQIAHAAGLTRTKAGRELMDRWHSDSDKYLAYGDEFVDPNGIAGAMYPGQIQTSFRLPEFGRVHQAAAKIGLYEATIGRALSSHAVDQLMTLWKVNVLASPVTALRANVESWLNAAADGMFKSGVKAKALLRETGKLDGEDIARSRGVDKVLSLAPLQAAGRYYRHIALRSMPEDEAVAAAALPEDLLHSYIHEQAAYHYALNVDPAGTTEATNIAQAGLRASKIQYDTKEGFDAAVKTRKGYEVTDEVDGISGANAYAHNLAIRINKDPKVARAIIARIENPDAEADALIEALESSSALRHSLFGKVFRDDEGKQVEAVTQDEKLLGKRQWADLVTEDMRQIVTGRNGVLQSKILDHVKANDKAPDADWILDNIKGQARPSHLLRPVIVASPQQAGVKGLVDALIDVEGKGYQWLVERLIQRHSTTPLFVGAYGKAKVGLEDFKQELIRQGGLSEEAAERATSEVAAHQAWNRIARMVDDPNLKSQIDVVGRSFFAFSRATTMMLRRWGSTFWRNPAQGRKLWLAGEAAVHSGVVYQDPTTGDWMFHFPASGVAQEVLMHAMSHIPGMDGLAQFPVSDFTGRVSTIIPGSANPLQYSTSPVVSVSGRWIADRFPEHRAWFDEVDRMLNGDQGQGRGPWATFEPAILKKLTDPLSSARDSITTSAMVGSLYNLYAAGLVPPDGASDSEIETFMGRLKTQTKTQLYLRAITGLLSPAVIGVPENENSSSKADFAFAVRGAQGLRDEYKIILNDVGGDVARAGAIWTALHPDETVYTQSGSQATTSRAMMPATKSALDWMNSHLGFINKYKHVSAFFIPEDSKDDPFSMAAYRAQLEEGLRQRKTPQEFLDGVRVSSAASVYYQVEDKYKADLSAAKASGNQQLASQHRADWLAWSKTFKAMHPTFAIHTEGSAANVRKADEQLNDLRSMVKNGDVPNGMSPIVTGMIQAYDGYQHFSASHSGGTSQAKAQRSAALSMFQDYMSQVVKQYPQIGDVYSGVFRVLDTHLETLD